MKTPEQNSDDSAAIAQVAAEWVLRLDRGLTPAEQDAYTQWLAADARHRDALAEQRWGWDELDRLAGIQDSVHALPDPDLLRPVRAHRPLRRFWPVGVVFAAAAALVAVFWWPQRTATEPARTPSYALAAPIEERTLEDGSAIALNRGAMIETAFTPGERRVKLLRGEANFTVTKNPARPFVVQVNDVDVRAVGTVFNVRLAPNAVEVLVSEGKVLVADQRASAAPEPVALVAGQSTAVSLAPETAPLVVATLDDAERERRIAWQPRLLDFNDESLAQIVAEFNRRNAVRLVLADPTLAGERLSASFRSDNVEGFVRLMESDFGMRAEWRGETEIALRRK